MTVLLADSMAASMNYDGRSSQLLPNMDDNIANVPNPVIKTKDELRCHCNLPVCVATGYMCKSAMGMCFSEIVDRSDLSKSRHGCLELLTSDNVEACHNEPSSSSAQHLHSQRPLVLCCQDDLCNLSAQQVQLRFNSALRNRNGSSSSAVAAAAAAATAAAAAAKSSSSSVGLEFRTVAMETRLYGDMNAGAGHATTKDLWLKAATIAVPIAGGFILVLLVFLAIRMLRRDRECATDYLPTQRNDFQMPWGKAQLHQHYHQQIHQQHIQQNGAMKWKDRQPMLLSSAVNSGQAAFQPKIVYLPTVHKISSQKKMWTKKSHIFPKSLDHV